MRKYLFYFSMTAIFTGCSGMQIIDPNKPNTKGTMQVDYYDGSLKLVGTHTCTMVGANGKRIYATDKSEAEARQRAIEKCQDQTLISFCNSSKTSCEKN